MADSLAGSRWLTLYRFGEYAHSTTRMTCLTSSIISFHRLHHHPVIMPPIPSSSFLAAPSASVVSLPATQPTELELAGFMHTSPGLFWSLVGVFAFAFVSGATWAGIEWRRRVGLRAGDDGKKTRSRRSRSKRTGAAEGEDDLEADKEEVRKEVYGSQNQGWAPPERTSSLVDLYFAPCLDPALIVPPPPHKHGLPLTIIQEEVEEDAINSSFKRQYDGESASSETEAMWTPSIVIDTSSPSPSDSTSSTSLAYLSARSPLSAFVIELSLPRSISASPSASTPSLTPSTCLQISNSRFNDPSPSSIAPESVKSPIQYTLSADLSVHTSGMGNGRDSTKENHISFSHGKGVGSGRVTWEETYGAGVNLPKDKKQRQPFGTTNVKTMPQTVMKGHPSEV